MSHRPDIKAMNDPRMLHSRRNRPIQRDRFKTHVEAWGRIIPRCGGHLSGYCLPHEGSDDAARGLIAFASLAEQETCPERPRPDDGGRANFAAPQRERFGVKEERTFTDVADATFRRPALACQPVQTS